jgi:hypothetical protein
VARRYLNDRARKFLREVTSIVLGVLIALAIGEVAEAVRWRVRVGNSMAAIRQEMTVIGLTSPSVLPTRAA